MFANLVSNLTTMFAQPTVQALTAGVLAGAIGGGALLATGAIPLGEANTAQTVALVACPGSGPVLGRISAGQALLVTGRSADGAWLEVFIDQPGVDRAWAPASALRLEASVDALPVAVCGAQPSELPTLAPPSLTPTEAPTLEPSTAPSVVATVAPAASPSATPRATKTPAPSKTPTVTPTPTPFPTLPPPPSPIPTPTPDLTAPSLSNFTITYPGPYNGSYYIGSLPCSPPTATIRVTASDASGVQSVTIYFKPQLMGTMAASMYHVGSGVWEYVLDPDNGWPSGEIGLWVAARDVPGNTSSQLPYGNPNSTADSSLIWDPFCIT